MTRKPRRFLRLWPEGKRTGFKKHRRGSVSVPAGQCLNGVRGRSPRAVRPIPLGCPNAHRPLHENPAPGRNSPQQKQHLVARQKCRRGREPGSEVTSRRSLHIRNRASSAPLSAPRGEQKITHPGAPGYTPQDGPETSCTAGASCPALGPRPLTRPPTSYHGRRAEGDLCEFLGAEGKGAGMSCKQKDILLHLLIALLCLALGAKGETGNCLEQEYRDKAGNCAACKQCGPGQELSKECGFGYGDDGQCVTCRPSRFKEDWGYQKCKPCLDCALVNRIQKANCTATSNAMCGDCLSGFYRKTKLGGFQEMECIPCGEPPPPYEPHCSTRVNLVKIPSTSSSPRDTALAAVICSALAMVLLALLILCIIYCKKQLMEKNPNWSMRLQDPQVNRAELSSVDRHRINLNPHRTCAYCQQSPGQSCGPVHLVPSCCFDDTCSLECSSDGSFPPRATEHLKRNKDCGRDILPSLLDVFTPSFDSNASEAWPLMQDSNCSDTSSFCESLHPPEIETSPDHATAFSSNLATPAIPPLDTCMKEENQPESFCLQPVSVETDGTNTEGRKQEGAEHLGDRSSLNYEDQEQNQMECNPEQVLNEDNRD
ncbi:tumor necrosis factor receptor superfamily member 19 [Narcine bancroftii]|uniref:tumor necrosis factor receptor superfamily member 19 n=1 Tax=Narcine bancroftii TaxID=1343680 RepID=UPI0038311BB4